MDTERQDKKGPSAPVRRARLVLSTAERNTILTIGFAALFCIFEFFPFDSVGDTKVVLIPGDYCVFLDQRIIEKRQMKRDYNLWSCGEGRTAREGGVSYLPVEVIRVTRPTILNQATYRQKYAVHFVLIENPAYEIAKTLIAMVLLGIWGIKCVRESG